MIAISDSATITISVVAFAVVCVVLVFFRLMTRKSLRTWSRLRVGFFIERDEKGDDMTSSPRGRARDDGP